MNKRAALVIFPIAVAWGFAVVQGCGSSSSDQGASDASTGSDGAGAGDGAQGDAAIALDGGSADSATIDGSHSDAAPDAACAHLGDPSPTDGGTRTIDAGAALTFIDIGPADRPIDLSADGTIALIQDGAKPTGDVYFYDTVGGVLAKKTGTGDPGYSLATALAAGTKRVSAYHGADPIVAGVWDSCGGWTDLTTANDGGCAGPPMNASGSFGINADGTVAVGFVWNGCSTAPTMWRETNGTWTPKTLTRLGMAGGSERASTVSDDGKVIGGFAQFPQADRSPAIWKDDGTGKLLDPTHLVVGEVLTMSADGKMAAGVWDLEGFVWSSTGGVVNIGKLAGAQPSDAVFLNGIAAQNKLVVGGCGDPSPGGLGNPVAAIVWTQAGGMRTLQDIVTAHHIAIPNGYALTNVTASSADGAVLLGYATDQLGGAHTFVLRLAVSAYGL